MPGMPAVRSSMPTPLSHTQVPDSVRRSQAEVPILPAKPAATSGAGAVLWPRISEAELLQALAPVQQVAVLALRWAGGWPNCLVLCCRACCWMHESGDLPLCSATCTAASTMCSPVHVAGRSWPTLPRRPPCRRGMQPGLLDGFSSAQQAHAFDAMFQDITNDEFYWWAWLCCASVQPATVADESFGTASNHHGKQGSVRWHSTHLVPSAVTLPSSPAFRLLATAGAAQRWATRSGPAFYMPAPDRFPVSGFVEPDLMAVCKSVLHVALCLAAPDA